MMQLILVQLLEKDRSERGIAFSKELDSNGNLTHFYFMTNRMKTLANKFIDVLIIDASHKTNRFEMPLLDIVTVDNLGKTCTVFIALLKSQKYEEFKWALESFKSNLSNSPKVIFTDEEEALRKGGFVLFFSYNFLGVKEVFKNSTNYLCEWHVEQNLKKKTIYLNKGKSKERMELYQLITKLPYSEYENIYSENYKTILNSDEVSETFKYYLTNKHSERELWVKCFIKSKFCCGMVTSSRIESKHNIYKKYLNGNSRLCEIYSVFQELEQLEIKNYNDEIGKFTIKQNKDLEKYKLISESKLYYGNYIIEKLKNYILRSLKYNVESNAQKTLW